MRVDVFLQVVVGKRRRSAASFTTAHDCTHTLREYCIVIVAHAFFHTPRARKPPPNLAASPPPAAAYVALVTAAGTRVYLVAASLTGDKAPAYEQAAMSDNTAGQIVMTSPGKHALWCCGRWRQASQCALSIILSTSEARLFHAIRMQQSSMQPSLPCTAAAQQGMLCSRSHSVSAQHDAP